MSEVRSVSSVACPDCRGAGRVGAGYLREDCPPCGGTGKVPQAVEEVKPANLAEALQAEITRARDTVLAQFLELQAMNLPNVIVAPQIAMIRSTLDSATRALAEGDVVACLRLYESLKGYEA